AVVHPPGLAPGAPSLRAGAGPLGPRLQPLLPPAAPAGGAAAPLLPLLARPRAVRALPRPGLVRGPGVPERAPGDRRPAAPRRGGRGGLPRRVPPAPPSGAVPRPAGGPAAGDRARQRRGHSRAGLARRAGAARRLRRPGAAAQGGAGLRGGRPTAAPGRRSG